MKFYTPKEMSYSRWRCVATGRSTDDEGFFDWRQDLRILNANTNQHEDTDYRTQISVAAAKEMARVLGYSSPDEVNAMVLRLDAMGEEIAELRNLLDKVQSYKELGRELEAVAV